MAFFGVDFGTTNSSAFEINRPVLERVGEAGRPLASVVAINTVTGEAMVGRAARDRRLELEEKDSWVVIPSIKRHLGTARAWTTNTRVWTPRDIAAEILRSLGREAQNLGIARGIERATLSLPVGLSSQARKVLRLAAQDAGITVTSFVSEPTAAFFRYSQELRHCRTVAVFDWGGGTLDVSVLELIGEAIHERATAGVPRAGDDMDFAVAQLTHSRIMQQRGLSLRLEEVATKERDFLLARAEKLKCDLAEAPEGQVAMTSYAGAPANVRVTREDVAPVLRPFVDAAVELLATTVKDAGLSVDAIDNIIVVGGSSRLWLLKERLATDERFAGRCRLAEEPEWDVAQGAAMLDEHPGAYTVAETLGMLLSDESYHELLRSGEIAGAGHGSFSLSLIEDSQHASLIVDRWVSRDRPRNAFQFSVPTLGFDREEIKVSYRISEDLVFELEALSTALGASSRRIRECSDLRFTYELGAR
jgi:molecular chaperone DnaK